MALSDLFKSDVTKTIAIGVATAAATVVVIPVLSKVGRPFARAALKTGFVFYEKTRETAAEIGEVLEDFVAEARAELEKDNIVASTKETPSEAKKPDNGVELKIE